MENGSFEHKLDARKEMMASIQKRLTNDIQFRHLMLKIRNITISKSVYELPETSFDVIFQNLLPSDLKKLGLTYDEIKVICLRARIAQVMANEADKVEVHPIELLPSPERYEYWLEKGKIVMNHGLFFNSIRCFDKSIEINSKCTEAWFFKGYCLFKLGNVTVINAPRYLRSANLIWPQLENLKNTLLKSLDCFNKTIEINSQYVDAYYYKGACLIEIGRPQNDFHIVKDARECFKKALAIDPYHKNAQTALKMCNESIG